MQSQKWWNDLNLFKPFNFRVILDYAPTSNAKEAEADQFYEDLQDVELNRKKKKTKMPLAS